MKKSKRQKIIKILEQSAKKGLSANKALAVLRSKGLGMRRKDFLNNYRTILNKPKKKNAKKYIPKKYDIPASEYKPAIIKTPEVKYRYYTEVTLYNSLTKSFETKYCQIDSRTKLTKAEIQRKVEKAFDPDTGVSGEPDLLKPTASNIKATRKANKKEAMKISKEARKKARNAFKYLPDDIQKAELEHTRKERERLEKLIAKLKEKEEYQTKLIRNKDNINGMS